jgi:hypothetical protein
VLASGKHPDTSQAAAVGERAEEFKLVGCASFAHRIILRQMSI